LECIPCNSNYSLNCNDFRIKTMFGSFLPPFCFCKRVRVLFTLLSYSGIQQILCCDCFCFVFLVYHMLPVFLDCPFLIALSVFSKMPTLTYNRANCVITKNSITLNIIHHIFNLRDTEVVICIILVLLNDIVWHNSEI
jgi:hypothetical protein